MLPAWDARNAVRNWRRWKGFAMRCWFPIMSAIWWKRSRPRRAVTSDWTRELQLLRRLAAARPCAAASTCSPFRERAVGRVGRLGERTRKQRFQHFCRPVRSLAWALAGQGGGAGRGRRSLRRAARRIRSGHHTRPPRSGARRGPHAAGAVGEGRICRDRGVYRSAARAEICRIRPMGIVPSIVTPFSRIA